VLVTLCFIFKRNPKAQDAFRVGGGFIWIVSVLDGITKHMQTQQQQQQQQTTNNKQRQRHSTPPSSSFNIAAAAAASEEEYNEESIFLFLRVLLHTLAAVLQLNRDNQRYFRDNIHFSTVTETLKVCVFLSDGRRLVDLVDDLITITGIVRGVVCI